MPTQQQPLEQRQAFARRARQDRLLTVGAILLQALLIVQELFPTDIARVVVLQADAPVGNRHRVLPGMNLSFQADLPPILITAEDVPAGIGRVLEQAQHPAVRQTAPDQFPIPGSPPTRAWENAAYGRRSVASPRKRCPFRETAETPGSPHPALLRPDPG